MNIVTALPAHRRAAEHSFYNIIKLIIYEKTTLIGLSIILFYLKVNDSTTFISIKDIWINLLETYLCCYDIRLKIYAIK